MNWDQVEGKWKQFSGSIKERWGKLTDDDLTTIGGKKDQLVGRIQERYGISREEAHRQLDDYLNTQGTSERKTEAERARRSGSF